MPIARYAFLGTYGTWLAAVTRDATKGNLKMTTNALVASAVLGMVLGAACGGTQEQPAMPAAGTPSSAEKAACGNHEPGKCGAPDAKPRAPAASDTALTIARTETIAPGGHFEINLSFASATLTKATFKASAPVSWNVHSHPASGMVEHQKGASASGEIAFQPSAAGVYSFLWKNDGAAAVTIEVTVSAERGVVEL